MSRSLLKQLVYQINTLPPTLPIALEIFYIDSKSGLAPKSAPIIDLFVLSCSNFDSVFVFFDGLDECTNDMQTKILNLIRRFAESDVRIFLTSQPQLEDLVKGSITNLNSVEIIASKGDLRNYLQQRFDSTRNKKGLDDSLLDKLVLGAEGTYISCRFISNQKKKISVSKTSN